MVQRFNDSTPNVYFRVELCGITGHKQFAKDCGVIIKPNEAVAVAAAMLRVFIEHGDRTDRKKARLKYLVDKWGVEKFLAETQKKLAFPLVKLPIEQCIKRPPSIKHGHIGVYRQKQKGKNYIGVMIPVGVLNLILSAVAQEFLAPDQHAARCLLGWLGVAGCFIYAMLFTGPVTTQPKMSAVELEQMTRSVP